MYIMFDQSGSMSDPAGNTTKWSAITTALKTFVEQPDAAGIGVGLQYFPAGASCPGICTTNADCGACGPCQVVGFFGICAGVSNDGCDVATYAKPEVAIAPLPGVAPAIVASMSAHSPSGGTPTSAALQGAIDHAKSWATQNADHVVVTVLATDGDPSNCDTNLANINAIAAAGANGVPKILTFVIGVGGSSAALNGIAQAGGTNQAFFVDANQNATDEFVKAMNEIRGAALACSYLIPEPAMGELDYGNVNVQYVPTAGAEPIIIPKVDSIAACPASGFAWYYDNNAAPKQIVMCASTCETIKKDTEGEVSILYGCETIVN
ncbi:MAG: VWA domain-containing protein, partial [Polyangiaceae bacterium]|nr:VWA domain-containing protein [Polyangiaceae bacterium]